jgi:Tfp pilus assembly protein PilX
MPNPPHAPRPGSHERGIVLAVALLFVLLSSVLVMTLMTTTTGERSQSSNAQTAKLALYAADAGVRTQQQVLANIAKAKLDSCLAAWTAAGANPAAAIVGDPTVLFPAGVLGGTGAATSTNPPFNASASVAFADAAVGPESQTYNYLFTIQSSGTAGAAGRRNVQSEGVLRVSATRGSFADYLLFMDQFMMPSGATIWFTSAGSFDGRVHTNTGFKFAYKPTFQDQVTQHDVNATFFNDGHSPVVANANNNGTIDVPNFYGGYLRNQPTVPLPTNAFNQQAAALGLALPPGTPPTNLQVNTAIGSGAGSGPPPNGIYLPNDGLGTHPHLTAGLYIQGNADKVKLWADTLGNQQWVQVTQGSTVRTIQIDKAANTTSLWNGVSATGPAAIQYAGVPPNGVLFGTGRIDQLTGPDRTGSYVNPAIATNEQLLVTANQDIVIQGDLTCDDYNAKTNVLGIYSNAGAVRVGTAAPDNLNIDAFVMACGASNGQFCVDNYDNGSPRGNVTLRGGAVSRYYGAFYTFNSSGAVKTGYGRNFHYDRRGLVPPYFPTTTRFDADVPSARTIAWKEI